MTSSDGLRRSVVKLFTVSRKADFYQPWAFGHERQSGGTGCIVEGNRILTNAHVVRNAVYVEAMKEGSARKFPARIEFVSHDDELALLTVEDPAFFADTQPVVWGELPVRQAKVMVYGFPIGGDELSVTEGVVSRIEVITYSHSRRQLLAFQTDAAINGGNSGGPVFAGGRCVGVAFQSHAPTTAQGIGYVVPVTLVERFFVRFGQQDKGGIPSLGAQWQRIESEALRAYLQLGETRLGVLVTRVLLNGSSHGKLQEGDVLLSLGGLTIAHDGTVALRDDDRVGLSHVVSQRRVGEALAVQVLRGGKELGFTIQLKRPTALIPRADHERKPSYCLFAGLMFLPLTTEYLAVWDWDQVDVRYRYLYENGYATPERSEVVVLSHVFAHSANAGYHKVRGGIVQKVNGQPIGSMRDLVRALKTPLGRFHVIEIDKAGDGGGHLDFHAAPGTHVVLDAAQVEAATREVMAGLGVTRDRSIDLDGV